MGLFPVAPGIMPQILSTGAPDVWINVCFSLVGFGRRKARENKQQAAAAGSKGRHQTTENCLHALGRVLVSVFAALQQERVFRHFFFKDRYRSLETGECSVFC